MIDTRPAEAQLLGRRKILVKKKHTPVCEIENPEFWSHRGKILVKKNYTPGVKKKFQNFFLIFF